MKIVVMGSWADSLINFRGPLLAEMVRRGHEVTGCAPEPPGETSKQLGALGVLYEQMPLERTGMNPLRDARALKAIKSLLRRIEPDILLSYTIKPVIYGSLAAGKTGVDNVYSMVTGLGYAFQDETMRQRLIKVAVRHLYRRSLAGNKSVFFQNPDDLALFLDERLIRKDQAVLVNGSGVDLNYFNFEEPASEPCTFLLIARLLKEKGIEEFVEAARILRESHPDVRFRLLGPFDSNPSAIRKKTIEGWQNTGLIDYLGETDDVRPAIASASVYVLPSYREGTPRSVLEAMSMGRPIITTDVPGCRETVVEGVNGFLVPSHDPVRLAAAMKRFIDEPEIIPAMGRKSREIATEKYDVLKVNARILDTMGIGQTGCSVG